MLKKLTQTIDLNQNMILSKTVMLSGSDPEQKKQEILAYFHKTFSTYESLFECLDGDNAFFERANPLRHPLIFYYGHTAVFFINKLNVAGLIEERIDPRLESTLAIGVDEMSWDDLNEENYDWPSPQQVREYRKKTRAIVDRFIRNCRIDLPINWNDPLWIILMGIEHERIHLETTAVLIRELPIAHVKQHPIWGAICPNKGLAPENELLDVMGGSISLGKSRDNPLYGWDNEYGQKTEKIKPFKASKYLVSNSEFLDFIKDDGYKTARFWTEEGWAWASFKKTQNPTYWIKDGNDYKYRTMLQIIDMPWDWPVDINYLEAKAFCNWKSEKTGKHIRMPTEAEWYLLRNLMDTDQPYWDTAPGNINLEHYMSASPVNEFEFPNGFYDIIGNVWQWTETSIDAYEGFEVHPVYDDFSTPTFDGKHNIFKGGCWISTGNYAIKDSRYAFRRHFFQNAGLRYVEGESIQVSEPNVYETDKSVSQYIEFHYGEEYLSIPNFPATCAEICLKNTQYIETRRALDIGCASGRTSFELAKVFDQVDAVDFSARLIQAPVNMQKNGSQRYTIPEEGDLVSYKEARLDKLGLKDIAHKVSFLQGDACNLAAKYTDYDLIFAGNLIDNIYDPEKFLKTIHARINSNGILILSSPYNWQEAFTDRSKWLGGFKAHTGENYTTLDGLKERLSPHFNLLETQDIPFAFRENKRNYRYTISEVSVWKKND